MNFLLNKYSYLMISDRDKKIAILILLKFTRKFVYPQANFLLSYHFNYPPELHPNSGRFLEMPQDDTPLQHLSSGQKARALSALSYKQQLYSKLRNQIRSTHILCRYPLGSGAALSE